MDERVEKGKVYFGEFGVEESVVEGKKDRKLDEKGEDEGERIELVLLVEAHNLLILLGNVVFILYLKLLKLSLHSLHTHGGANLRGENRIEKEADNEGKRDDGEPHIAARHHAYESDETVVKGLGEKRLKHRAL
jgi:hypothetical protein